MAIDKKFLDVLACPICRGDLENAKSKEKDFLKCKECGKFFPVEEGIPILLKDSALADPDRE